MASAAAGLLAAAVGASAEARGRVIRAYAQRQLLRRVLGGLRRVTHDRSPRVRALVAEARASQLRLLHADVETAQRALAGEAGAQAVVPGGRAAVARAKALWQRSRRAWPVAEATAGQVGSLRQQWRWRQLLLRWRLRAESSSRAALAAEVLEEEAQTPAERALVAGRAAQRARRAARLVATARRAVTLSAAAQPPAPRRRRQRAGGREGGAPSDAAPEGAAGAAGVGARALRAALARAAKRPSARATAAGRRAAKAARREVEAAAVERAERAAPLAEPAYVAAVTEWAQPRPAWSAAAEEADQLVVLAPARAPREGPGPVRGRDVRGSRGRAMQAAIRAGPYARGEGTRSSVGQRVVPPARGSWAAMLGLES